MALEIIGKLVQVLPEQTGIGKNGAWIKQDFIIETQEQYPKKVCFSAWGDKAATVKSLEAGSDIKIAFNIESREFNGRWYTDLRPWKIEAQSNTSGAQSNTPPLPDNEYFGNTSTDLGAEDLPF